MVKPDDDIKKVIAEITGKRLGATAVVDSERNLLGVITDGDIRRMLENHSDRINSISARDIMCTNPKTIEKGELAVNALSLIRQNNITQVSVSNKGKYEGIIHLHDLMREGIV
jgi:arabinose-5-phosphate isomerase